MELIKLPYFYSVLICLYLSVLKIFIESICVWIAMETVSMRGGKEFLQLLAIKTCVLKIGILNFLDF